jgi:hypothetical protein
VGHRGAPPHGDAASVAQRFVSELRFRIESNDPAALELAQQVEGAVDGEPLRLRDADASLGFRSFAVALVARIEREVRLGQVTVELRRSPSLTQRPVLEVPSLPPLPPERESATQSFEVRFVDEVGQAVSGVAIEIDTGEVQQLTTNPAGIALLDGVTATTGSALIPDPDALQQALDPRWTAPRAGSPPPEGNSTQVAFEGAPVGPIGLKPAVTNRVVLTPPLGTLFAELRDKSGRVLHTGCDYKIDGPQALSGTTDDFGRLLHEQVFPGDYTLTLTVTTSVGDETKTNDFETPLVLRGDDSAEPQVRRLGAVRRCVLGRLSGPIFETNKSLLLPTAIDRLGRLSELYAENSPGELLIVGHTDTTGEPSINDPLSLERADNMAAFLTDDVETWLKMYGSSVPAARRWGKHEDGLMLSALPDIGQKSPSADSVRWFQSTRGLTVDGDAGPETRRELITEYMQLDGATLSEDDLALHVTTHGCGENFPLDDSGDDIDSDPQDDKEDSTDRRVELFFFDSEFGIVPTPPGKNSGSGSTEYPAWRQQVDEEFEIGSGNAAAVCEIDVELSASDGTLLASRPCKVHVGDKEVRVTIDANGRLFLDQLPPDDYLVEVDDFSQFVTAMTQGLGTQKVCMMDVPESPS